MLVADGAISVEADEQAARPLRVRAPTNQIAKRRLPVCLEVPG